MAKKAGLHYDLRLEKDGVLLSWAIPKGLPTKGKTHLAIKQPNHNIDYLLFEGNIESGYGAGKVRVIESGEYKRNGTTLILNESIYRFFPIGGNKWLIKLRE